MLLDQAVREARRRPRRAMAISNAHAKRREVLALYLAGGHRVQRRSRDGHPAGARFRQAQRRAPVIVGARRPAGRKPAAAAKVPVILDPLLNCRARSTRSASRSITPRDCTSRGVDRIHPAGGPDPQRVQSAPGAGVQWPRVAVGRGTRGAESGPAEIFGSARARPDRAGLAADLVLWSGDPSR